MYTSSARQRKEFEMTTIATIAAEYNMQTYELAAFLDLGTEYDPHAELSEDQARDIMEILDYDLAHNTPSE
jgi:hypothetical protein